MFRRQGLSLRFTPENGMAVLCFGRVSVYTVRGDLQLYVEEIEPQGQGALYIAFEQLKKKLLAQGLFAEERKRRLPFLPRTIGIVTSDGGAALRDMLRIIDDRYSDRRIIVRAVKVQGDGAAGEIARAIHDLNRLGDVDVMIVGRGGGSLEDLWAFNEEVVARAIFASNIPVVSAVGHEIDFTIADFVADCRAPTPTAAAEMILPRKLDLREQLDLLELQLRRSLNLAVSSARQTLGGLVKRLADPSRKLCDHQQRLDDLSIDLLRRFQERLRQSKNRLSECAARLHALSPLAVLDRGYAIAHKLPEQKIVKRSEELAVGDRIRITFSQGESTCRVEKND
jgi:exodeoxyribonuclease VII large subunit